MIIFKCGFSIVNRTCNSVNGDSLEISSTFLLFKDLRTGGTATVVTSTGSTEKEFAMPGV